MPDYFFPIEAFLEFQGSHLNYLDAADEKFFYVSRGDDATL